MAIKCVNCPIKKKKCSVYLYRYNYFPVRHKVLFFIAL